jgi:ATP-dependent RNA helicase DDX56/DBP9
MVKEARVAEIRQELLNSARLDAHFRENPDDLKVLRHDKVVLHPARRLEHLKHVPDYLMPAGMAVGEDPTDRQVTFHLTVVQPLHH